MEELINGSEGAKGLIIFTSSISEVEVEKTSVVKLPQFNGAFLTIGDAGEQSKVTIHVHMLIFLKAIQFRIKYTVTNLFEI